MGQKNGSAAKVFVFRMTIDAPIEADNIEMAKGKAEEAVRRELLRLMTDYRAPASSAKILPAEQAKKVLQAREWAKEIIEAEKTRRTVKRPRKARRKARKAKRIARKTVRNWKDAFQDVWARNPLLSRRRK